LVGLFDGDLVGGKEITLIGDFVGTFVVCFDNEGVEVLVGYGEIFFVGNWDGVLDLGREEGLIESLLVGRYEDDITVGLFDGERDCFLEGEEDSFLELETVGDIVFDVTDGCWVVLIEGLGIGLIFGVSLKEGYEEGIFDFIFVGEREVLEVGTVVFTILGLFVLAEEGNLVCLFEGESDGLFVLINNGILEGNNEGGNVFKIEEGFKEEEKVGVIVEVLDGLSKGYLVVGIKDGLLLGLKEGRSNIFLRLGVNVCREEGCLVGEIVGYSDEDTLGIKEEVSDGVWLGVTVGIDIGFSEGM